MSDAIHTAARQYRRAILARKQAMGRVVDIPAEALATFFEANAAKRCPHEHRRVEATYARLTRLRNQASLEGWRQTYKAVKRYTRLLRRRNAVTSAAEKAALRAEMSRLFWGFSAKTDREMRTPWPYALQGATLMQTVLDELFDERLKKLRKDATKETP